MSTKSSFDHIKDPFTEAPSFAFDVVSDQAAKYIKQEFGINAGRAFKFSNKYLKTPEPEGENPRRDKFVSVATYIAMAEMIAMMVPQRLGAYLTMTGAERLAKMASNCEPGINAIAKNPEVAEYWDRQWLLTNGEGLSFAGAVAGAQRTVKLAQIPDEFLQGVYHQVTSVLKSTCDQLGLTEKNVAHVAMRSLEILSNTHPSTDYSALRKKVSEQETAEWEQRLAEKQKTPKDVPESPLKKKVQPQKNRTSPKEATEQSQTQEMEEEAEKLNEQIINLSDYIKTISSQTSQKRGYSSSASPSAATQETDFTSYMQFRNTFEDAFTGTAVLIHTFGNHQTAAKIEGLCRAGVQVADSCYMLANSTSAFASTGAMMALSPIAPYVGLICAAATLYSIFNEEETGDDSMQVLIDEIQQARQVILQHIALLHRDMMLRLDHLEDKIDRLLLHTMRGFLHMEKQGIDFKAPVLYSLMRIENDLKELQAIDRKVDIMLLKDMGHACSEIDQYPIRYGSLQKMKEKEFKRHAKTLEDAMLGVSVPHNCVNGYLHKNLASATHINKLLSTVHAEGLLGYLSDYIESVLHLPLPKGVESGNLPNTELLTLGINRYVTLRSQFTHVDFDNEGIQVKQITNVADHALAFIEHIQDNKKLFEMLLTNYQKSLTYVQECIRKAVNEKNSEILTETCSLLQTVNENFVKKLPSTDASRCQAACSGYGAYIYITWYTEYAKEMITIAQSHVAVKDSFIIDIMEAKVNLLDKHHKLPLQAFAAKKTPAPEVEDFLLPLSKLGESISKLLPIPSECYVAECLGIGEIICNFELKKSVVLSEICKSATVDFCISVSFLLKDKKTILPYFDTTVTSNVANTFPASGIYYMVNSVSGRTMMLKTAWDAHHSFVIEPHADAENNRIVLSTLIDETLIAHRKNVLISLFNPETKLGADFHEALEKLDASYTLLHTFGAIAGFGNREKKALTHLLNSEKICKHHQDYLNHEVSETAPFFPQWSDGLFTAIVTKMLARFSKKQDIYQNPFAAGLQSQLMHLGVFSLNLNKSQDLKKPIPSSSEQQQNKVTGILLQKIELMDREAKEQEKVMALLSAKMSDLEKTNNLMHNTMLSMQATMDQMYQLLKK